MKNFRWLRALSAPLVLLMLMTSVTVGSVKRADAGDAVAATAGAADIEIGSLGEMLGRLPAMQLFDTGDQGVAMVSYVNVAAQLAAAGLTSPSSQQDPDFSRWLQVMNNMPPVTGATSRLFTPDWRDSFGFDGFQVDQSAEYRRGVVGYVTVLRGRFIEAEEESALKRSGYKPISIDGMAFFSSGEDGEIDLKSSVGRMALANMNNAAFLEDGVLAFASTRDDMRTLIEVEQGDAESLATQEDVAPLVQMVQPDLVATWITSGLAFALSDPTEFLLPRPGGTPDMMAFATRESERNRLPQLKTVLLGVTAGGPFPPLDDLNATPEPLEPGMPTARFQVGLLLSDPAAADVAVSVLEDRLVTLRTGPDHPSSPELDDRSYAELFPGSKVNGMDGEPVVLIDLNICDGVSHNALFALYYGRYLDLIAW
ncbi:MAG: hypothetical protein H0T49_08050 [Chloroflexia bacterium]|nr:hypothetical protein [Chloroflexia bacterium]